MTREPPPLAVGVPVGAVAGAAIGVISASFYLTWALGLDLQAFDMLLVARLSEIERTVYAEEMRHAHLGIAGAAVLGAGLAAAATFKRRLTTYGDAHWQSRTEMRKNGLIGTPGTGFVCAKLGPPASKTPYVVAQDRPHVMMVAPTRAGKGVGFVIPNLLAFEGSVVALDVKGELYEATARWRAREGRLVHRFAPFDWEQPGVRYNPLEAISKLKSHEQRFTRVEKLANLFLDRDNKQNDTFSEAGKSIFVAACMLAMHRGTPTLGAVREIVMEGESKRKQYRKHAGEAAEFGDDTTSLMWMEAGSTSERLLTSNIQALMTGGFRAWNNPAVRRATSASDLDFATFRAERQSLYLCVAEDDIEALTPLLRMMFSDLIATLRDHEPGEDEPHPVMIMLDEFQQMGAMPYLERAIHTLASYGGRVAIIAQSVAALDRIYGPEGREGLEAGAALKLYIQPRDTRTVAEVSRAVGSCTREAVTRSYGRYRGLGGLHGQSVREEERPLLSETEARTMDVGEVIVLAAPLMPVRARRIEHYEDPTFTDMLKAQEAMPWPGTAGLAAEGRTGGAAPAVAASERASAAGAPAAATAPIPVPPRPPSAEARPSGRHGGPALPITPETPRDATLPREVTELIRRLDTGLVQLAEQIALLKKEREENRPWWEVPREQPPAPATKVAQAAGGRLRAVEAGATADTPSTDEPRSPASGHERSIEQPRAHVRQTASATSSGDADARHLPAEMRPRKGSEAEEEAAEGSLRKRGRLLIQREGE